MRFVAADRIPGVAQPRGAAQGRAAFAADPDPIELDPASVDARRLLGPQYPEHPDIVVSHPAALGKGHRRHRVEFRIEQPAPMPTMSRPPDRMSIVASILAASTAGRWGTT